MKCGIAAVLLDSSNLTENAGSKERQRTYKVLTSIRRTVVWQDALCLWPSKNVESGIEVLRTPDHVGEKTSQAGKLPSNAKMAAAKSRCWR